MRFTLSVFHSISSHSIQHLQLFFMVVFGLESVIPEIWFREFAEFEIPACEHSGNAWNGLFAYEPSHPNIQINLFTGLVNKNINIRINLLAFLVATLLTHLIDAIPAHKLGIFSWEWICIDFKRLNCSCLRRGRVDRPAREGLWSCDVALHSIV